MASVAQPDAESSSTATRMRRNMSFLPTRGEGGDFNHGRNSVQTSARRPRVGHPTLNVAFRSAKERSFAERKATLRRGALRNDLDEQVRNLLHDDWSVLLYDSR
jgi:hypothetical protein